MPEYIPARKGFAEQWLFEPPDRDDLKLAVRIGREDRERGYSVIHSRMIRFLVHFEQGPSFPVAYNYPTDEGEEPEPVNWRTAWVDLQTFRADLERSPSQLPLRGMAAKYLGWQIGWISRVISVTLANG